MLASTRKLIVCDVLKFFKNYFRMSVSLLLLNLPPLKLPYGAVIRLQLR